MTVLNGGTLKINNPFAVESIPAETKLAMWNTSVNFILPEDREKILFKKKANKAKQNAEHIDDVAFLQKSWDAFKSGKCLKVAY